MKSFDLPTYGIVVVHGRTNNWIEETLQSIERQVLKPDNVVVVENTDREKSIGACRNLGAEQVGTDWVLYVDDDDFISPLYTVSIVFAARHYDSPDLVHISTYATVYDPEAREAVPIPRVPIGMWRREFVLKERFDESLPSLEDVDLLKRAIAKGYKALVFPENIGYYYRQHADKTSPRYIIVSGTSENTER